MRCVQPCISILLYIIGIHARVYDSYIRCRAWEFCQPLFYAVSMFSIILNECTVLYSGWQQRDSNQLERESEKWPPIGMFSGSASRRWDAVGGLAMVVKVGATVASAHPLLSLVSPSYCYWLANIHLTPKTAAMCANMSLWP